MSYEALHLESDEHVLLEVRKHWIVFAGHALWLMLLALFPFIIYEALLVFVPGTKVFFEQVFSYFSGNKEALFLFFYCLWLLFLWVSFFLQWTKYYLDVWYVTEKRIVDIDQKQLFHREVSNLRFDKIQDVTIDVQGLIATFLDFGNVRVQTAAEDSGDFIMETVRNPERVRKIIFSQHNEIGDTPLRQAKYNNPSSV